MSISKPLLLTLLLVRCAVASHAQDKWRSPLPVDSTTQRIAYAGVVEVPGATKDELYSRAREWFANTFGSSKAVLEMDDRAVGKLIGKAYAEFNFDGSIGKPLPWAMWRKIKIELKDGKYRYTITDFGLGGPIQRPDENNRPLESWLAPSLGSRKQPGKLVMSVVDGAQSTGQAEASSLRAAMTGKASKSDW